eukprot:COSAG06_NODE_13123_length_1290_cov_1.183879_2_plen_92_part_01
MTVCVEGTRTRAQSRGTKFEYVGANTTEPPSEAEARNCAPPHPKLWMASSSAVMEELLAACGAAPAAVPSKHLFVDRQLFSNVSAGIGLRLH